MSKKTKSVKLPVQYPSVPDSTSGPTRHNEADIPARPDRMPSGTFELSSGSSRAELRLRIEQLLSRREEIPPEALANLGEDARALMISLLDDEAIRSSPAVFHRLIATLGQMSVKRSVAPLSAILANASESDLTRAYAASALGRIGEPAAVEGLSAAISAKDDMVRRQVAIALSRLERLESVPHLRKLQADSSVAVAEAAAEGLRSLEQKFGQKLGVTFKTRPARQAKGKVAPAADE